MATLEGFSFPFFPSSVKFLTWVANFLCMDSQKNYPLANLPVICVSQNTTIKNDSFFTPSRYSPTTHLKSALFAKNVQSERATLKAKSNLKNTLRVNA